MTVASKSAVDDRRRRVASRTRAVTAHNPRVIPLHLKAKGLPSRDSSSQPVTILPSSRSAPFWLLQLCVLQRRCSVVMFVLIAAMLTVYGWTVYSQKMWSQAYRKLETLQRHERQLTTTNEVLKNQMALQAEQPATDLVPPNPDAVIFLPPAPQPPAPAADPPADQTKQTIVPLGY